jgi:hypothetical protein
MNHRYCAKEKEKEKEKIIGNLFSFYCGHRLSLKKAI